MSLVFLVLQNETIDSKVGNPVLKAGRSKLTEWLTAHFHKSISFLNSLWLTDESSGTIKFSYLYLPQLTLVIFDNLKL